MKTKLIFLLIFIGGFLGKLNAQLIPDCFTGCCHNPNNVAYTSDYFLTSGAAIPYYATHDPNAQVNSIRRLIVAIHGSSRTAKNYFDRISSEVKSQEDASHIPSGQTMVIAPQFLTKDDIKNISGYDREDYHHWGHFLGLNNCTGWVYGAKGKHGNSFDIVTTIINTVKGNAPHLKEVIIMGHSAGGQFTQRFAAYTDLPEREAYAHITFKFMVANPGSYLYMNNYRYTDDANTYTSDQWHLAGGNLIKYKYGLNSLPSHFPSAAVMRERFRRHHVFYLIGEDDLQRNIGCEVSGNCSNFPDSPADMAQGSSRLARAHIYYKNLINYYRDKDYDIRKTHVKLIVPDVNHSSRILVSPTARNLIYKPIEEIRGNNYLLGYTQENYTQSSGPPYAPNAFDREDGFEDPLYGFSKVIIGNGNEYKLYPSNQTSKTVLNENIEIMAGNQIIIKGDVNILSSNTKVTKLKIDPSMGYSLNDNGDIIPEDPIVNLISGSTSVCEGSVMSTSWEIQNVDDNFYANDYEWTVSPSSPDISFHTSHNNTRGHISNSYNSPPDGYTITIKALNRNGTSNDVTRSFVVSPYNSPSCPGWNEGGVYKKGKILPEVVGDKGFAIKVYPNPANEILNLKINLENSSNVTYSLFNSIGNMIGAPERYLGLLAGVHKFAVSLDNLSSGVYYLNIKVGRTVQTEKIVIFK